MHLVMVESDENKGTMYEFPTYAKARYFTNKHRSIGARMLGKIRRIDNLDLFCERVQIEGRKYKSRLKAI